MPQEAPAQTRVMTYDEAVRTAIIEMMELDERVFCLGEDIGGRYGGAFAVTRGMAKQFGPRRVLNTPIAESAIVGCGVGAALVGKRPVVEIQFADFLAPAFNALVNNAAKIYWRYHKPVPMVVRLPYAGATADIEQKMLGGGPFHSQCPEAWFLRTPGWKIVAPGTPRDAKGLMTAAIRDNNPVIYLEAKGLYGVFPPKITQEVPVGADFEVPIGRAHVRRSGTDITLLTYGAMIYVADRAAAELAGEIDLEVIDLRTLMPLDEAAILASVEKTGRVMILHEDSRTGGVGAELAAIIAERALFSLEAPIVRVAAPDTPALVAVARHCHKVMIVHEDSRTGGIGESLAAVIQEECFEWLDAPVRIIGALDTPVPYSPPLEYAHLPKPADVIAAARRLMRV